MQLKDTSQIKERKGHLAKDQAELEVISHNERHKAIIEEHQKLGGHGYYSGTKHGRALLRSRTDGGNPRLIALADALEDRHERLHGKTIAAKPLRNVVEAIGTAMLINPGALAADKQQRLEHKEEEGLAKLPPSTARIPRPYAPDVESPFAILSLVVMKVFVDQMAIGRSDDNDWPTVASIYQRIGRALLFEYKSAICYIRDPFLHQELHSTWNRKHQTPVNKYENLNEAFRKISRANEFELSHFNWSLKEQAQVGRILAEVFVSGMNLVEKVKPKWLAKENKWDYTRIRPTEDLIHSFKELMSQYSEGKGFGYPMIEPPLQWTLDDPTSGGYHLPALRDANPVIRGHEVGGNESRPCEAAIDSLNLLGETAWQPDHEMMAAFEWAITHRYPEAGLPLEPSPTVFELQQEGKEHDRKREAGEIRWEDDSPEVENYKAKRREQFNQAVDAEAKFFRTIEALSAIRPVRQFAQVWFSYSADYRGRMYPQQTFLNPQSSSAEKSLIRFRDGEQITTKAQRNAINEAIGVAWKDGKMSLEARQEWGQKAVSQILPLLTGEPDDLSVVIKADADEPWDLLKLLYCFKRWDQDDALWDIGLSLSMPASQASNC